MPELPEVETIRRIVERELTGRTLTGLELTLPKLVRDSPLPDLELLVGSDPAGRRSSRQSPDHPLVGWAERA